jgi:hypothetical protein
VLRRIFGPKRDVVSFYERRRRRRRRGGTSIYCVQMIMHCFTETNPDLQRNV